MTAPTRIPIDEFDARLRRFAEEARAAAAAADSAESLERVRAEFVGRTSGRIHAFQAALPGFAPEERRAAGRAFNDAKRDVEAALDERRAALAARSVAGGPELDLTMPPRRRWRGAKHPVTLVVDEIVEIFRELGFTVALGPEAETDWYNFGALNFPADHPALDAHDTLYLGDGALLRTHTSPVQVRTLQRARPPIRILAPGMVYRRDFFDASHAPAFAQLEGMAVDEGIGFVDLKATLTHFANRFFGTTRTRFRPSFFPFTEPSAEMDVECRLCAGSGCPACKHTGWMEILGSGMMHPAVLEAAGLDSEQYTGWAFGMGPGRVAMLRYNLPDIRLLYDSDVRFLEQFGE
ncbi:MAG TPA: phenylalanine--tRNA ligase subunit alpha [Gemmatimonadaceae bacterium]|nr:phenylalanine--tRNA ligase subunit alpha [Gemmatimonadaceae bacterium]